jgi:hypothetical protein
MFTHACENNYKNIKYVNFLHQALNYNNNNHNIGGWPDPTSISCYKVNAVVYNMRRTDTLRTSGNKRTVSRNFSTKEKWFWMWFPVRRGIPIKIRCLGKRVFGPTKTVPEIFHNKPFHHLKLVSWGISLSVAGSIYLSISGRRSISMFCGVLLSLWWSEHLSLCSRRKSGLSWHRWESMHDVGHLSDLFSWMKYNRRTYKVIYGEGEVTVE